MKILWVVNIPLPEASKLMKEKELPFAGWLENSSMILSETIGVKLWVAFPKRSLKEIRKIEGKKITYFAFPAVHQNVKSTEINKHFEVIIREVQPNVVHVYGTEYSHTLAVVNVCKNFNVAAIISIQGLVSVIAKHYFANLPLSAQKSYTLRALLTRSNIKQLQKKFIKQGEVEKEALRKVDYVIGRTTWDKACSTQINQNLQYFHCNETLRNEFYLHEWKLDTCERYSIFLSQGSYPVKGLHHMIEALPLILERFPKCKLYIGGQNILNEDTIMDKLKRTSYGKYINKLVKKYNLQSKIIFTGVLGEKKMCQQYLRSHVFVCPSSIENSPNSLGEAMILGVPSVAANVGGIPDLLVHKREGFLYQGDAPYMLAHYICEIFRNDKLAKNISEKARESARKRHDKIINHNKLMEIYQYINNSNRKNNE